MEAWLLTNSWALLLVHPCSDSRSFSKGSQASSSENCCSELRFLQGSGSCPESLDPFPALVPGQTPSQVCLSAPLWPSSCASECPFPLDIGWGLRPPLPPWGCPLLLSTPLPDKVLFAKDSPKQHTQKQQPPHAAASWGSQWRLRECPGAF